VAAFFTIEYGVLFDVINPGLASLGYPVALGGTSNHFRTRLLQDLLGWDSWNVTEDADLGIRLALAGWRVGDLPSATLEEAPQTLGAWMRQRTRWLKGFMQVCVTHSRHPVRVFAKLGFARGCGAVSVIVGTVASALGYPVFTLLALAAFLDGGLFRAEAMLDVFAAACGISLFVGGGLAMIAPAIVALRRRGWWRLLPLVPLLPLYYVLVSAAAWLALYEFFRAPNRWNKTEHGLARTSRASKAKPSYAAVA
jgi:cellulose synthase/poly-beta-1,6-N-acetylglucosamine synthase-like glycosyltransferase